MYDEGDINLLSDFLRKVLELNKELDLKAVGYSTHTIPNFSKALDKSIKDLQNLKSRHEKLLRDLTP